MKRLWILAVGALFGTTTVLAQQNTVEMIATRADGAPIQWQDEAGQQERIRVNVNLAFNEKGRRAFLGTPYITPAEDGKNGSFRIEMGGYTADSYTFYAIAPYNGWFAQHERESAAARIRLVLPTEQTASATACDPKARLLFAKSEPMTDLSGTVTMPFRHVTAYGCLNLKGVSGKIRQVIIQGGRNNLSGRAHFDVERGALMSFGGSDAKNAAWKRVTINTASEDVHFAIYPTNLTGKTILVCVIFEDGSYWVRQHKFREGEGEFRAGRVNAFTVDFGASNTRKYPLLALHKEDGEVKGVRYWISENGKTAKVVSLKRCEATPWCVDRDGVEVTEATDANDISRDGKINWKTLTKWISAHKYYKLPIYDFCANLGEGWYWANHNELRDLGLAYKFMGDLFDALLTESGGDALNAGSDADGDKLGDRYWSSREGVGEKTNRAYWVRMDIGEEALNNAGKERSYFGRAIKVVPLK